MDDKPLSDVRPSPIAGTWYPGDPHILREDIEVYLEQAHLPEPLGEVVGLVVPHAGLVYSGQTAAHAFAAVQGQSFDRVVIVSPSHHRYSGELLSSAHAAYRTPLGDVPVDWLAQDALDGYLAPERYQLNRVRGDREHALEIELPFLQVVLPDGFTLLPVMMQDQRWPVILALAEALVALVKSYQGRTLLVASSDLSHFYSQGRAEGLDRTLIDALGAGDAEKLMNLVREGKAEACGAGPITSVLLAGRGLGAEKVTIADYRTSAAVNRDTSSVVGYVSAIISKQP